MTSCGELDRGAAAWTSERLWACQGGSSEASHLSHVSARMKMSVRLQTKAKLTVKAKLGEKYINQH